MMWVITSFLRIRVLVVALVTVLLVGGIWQMRETPLDAVPEFSPLSLQVRTEALGLSTAEVESLITVPLEADLLAGVPWMKSIESESMTGVSVIEMFFTPGTDIMHARQMVQERLNQTAALPNVSKPPMLLNPIATANRIMNIGLSSKSVSLIDMSVQAWWTIVPRLVGVPGVANVSIWGLRNRQIQVLIDPARLHSNGVTLEQVVKTAGEAVWASPLTFLNSSTPGTGGFIDTPNQRLNLRHVSPIATAQEFAKIPVFGTSHALGEVADLVESHQPLIGDALLKDGPGLLLVVEKFPGFNTVDVTRRVEATLANLRPGLPGIEIETASYHPASFIERASSNLFIAVLVAVMLAIVAFIILLRSWRAALIAELSISVSLVACALVLHLCGVGFSMMVMAGLLIAIAAIVDDAIVDTENMLRQVRQAGTEGNKPLWSIIAGASLEMRGPMLYATLIIVLAAVPILFIQGLSAALFWPLIWAYILAVVAALVVALAVTPALVMLLTWKAPMPEPADSVIMRCLQALYARIAAPMVGSLTFTFVLVAAGVLLGVLVWAQRERSLVPEFKETDVFVEWQAPAGTSLPAMNRMTSAMMRDVRAVPGVRDVTATIGRALLSHDVADVNTAQIWISFDPKADYEDTLEALQKAVMTYPEAHVESFLSKKVRESLTGEDEAISVRLYGQDLVTLRSKAEEIRQLLTKIEGVTDAKVEQQVEQQTIEVAVDLDKAGAYGLKPGDVRRAAAWLTSGITVGALFQDQKVFDVVVWGRPEIRSGLADIQNLLIDTESGTQVRLSEVANVQLASAPNIIHRQGVSRRIDIDAAINGRPLGAVTEEVKRRIKDVALPFEYHAQVLGEHVERKEALNSLYSYFLAAGVIVFLLLQAALGSWSLAALSILGVPVAALGGLVTTFVAGGAISLGTFLGFVPVLGLATRNGIMLAQHYQNLEQREGQYGRTLAVRGASERLPAVIASAVTIGLIALPFVVLGDIAGLEILHPAAVVIVGGVFSTTLLILFVVPAIYGRFTARPAPQKRVLEAEIA